MADKPTGDENRIRLRAKIEADTLVFMQNGGTVKLLTHTDNAGYNPARLTRQQNIDAQKRKCMLSIKPKKT